jgi:hypothetical protein
MKNKILSLPSLEILEQRFYYDPDSGILTHKKSGKPAGYYTDGGWLRVKVNNKHYRVARIVWKMHYKEEPPEGLDIDHINRIRTDNRIKNLRIVTRKINNENSVRVINARNAPPKPTVEEIRRGAPRCSKIAVVLVTPNGEEKNYESISEAARDNGLNRGNLYKILGKKLKKHKGYTMRYDEE